MISSSEHFVEVYEALDTVAEDLAQLRVTEAELLEMCETPEDRSTVTTEVLDQQRLFGQRRDYILRSVLGGLATTPDDLHIARLEYVNKYETPEEQEAAARRVRVYNVLLDTVRHNGDVPRGADDISLDATQYLTERPMPEPNVRLHGRVHPVTGETWYDLTNPRTVEFIGGTTGRSSEKVVAMYPIRELHVGDNGETTVIAHVPSTEHDIRVKLTADSRTWYIDDDNRLVLFVPDRSISLSESSVQAIERQLSSTDETAQVAVQATHANVPNIIESFEHPDHANPVPLSTPKSN